MSGSVFTREELFPVWDRLNAAAMRARELFRAGGSEAAFRSELASLGFYGASIDIEVEFNRPPGEERRWL